MLDNDKSNTKLVVDLVAFLLIEKSKIGIATSVEAVISTSGISGLA